MKKGHTFLGYRIIDGTKAFKRMIKVFENFKKYTYDVYVYLCGDVAYIQKEMFKKWII